LVRQKFEKACDRADIETASQAIHELAQRRNWPSQREYLEGRVVSRFPLLATGLTVVSDFVSTMMGDKNVYVVLLRIPTSSETSHGLYVGMMGLRPEERLLNHRTGKKASRIVRKNGVCLLPILYERLNPMSYEEAQKIEFDLKNAFEKAGLLSFGGH
jgi:hypothetical protein